MRGAKSRVLGDLCSPGKYLNLETSMEEQRKKLQRTVQLKELQKFGCHIFKLKFGGILLFAAERVEGCEASG